VLSEEPPVLAASPDAGVSPKPWGIPAILAGLALPTFFLVAAIAANVAQDTNGELSDTEAVYGLLFSVLILDGALVGVPMLFVFARYHLGWDALGLRAFDRDLWWLPFVAAAGAHVAVVIYSIVLTVLGIEGPEQDLDELFEHRWMLPLTAIATLVAAPLAEEIFFRGFIFAGLIRPFGVTAAMVISGALFSIFHVTGPETVGLILPFTVIGIIFAWVYYRSGSLWTAIATHALFNSVSFIFLAASGGNT
jgi:membrane protease YdiL (CAAX protease family)